MMHTPEEINAAVTATVKTALKNAGMADTMLAKDVYEEIPRPSAKVIFGKTKISRYSGSTWQRECRIVVAWNAPNVYTFKIDCLRAQQVIEEYLLKNGIRMEDGTVLSVDEIEGEIIEAAVILAFSVSEIGQIEGFVSPDEEDTELMEILQTTYEQEDY